MRHDRRHALSTGGASGCLHVGFDAVPACREQGEEALFQAGRVWLNFTRSLHTPCCRFASVVAMWPANALVCRLENMALESLSLSQMLS